MALEDDSISAPLQRDDVPIWWTISIQNQEVEHPLVPGQTTRQAIAVFDLWLIIAEDEPRVVGVAPVIPAHFLSHHETIVEAATEGVKALVEQYQSYKNRQ